MIFRFREGDENSSKPPSTVAGRKTKEKQKKKKNKMNKEWEGGAAPSTLSHVTLLTWLSDYQSEL
jgi:hypothetical protein